MHITKEASRTQGPSLLLYDVKFCLASLRLCSVTKVIKLVLILGGSLPNPGHRVGTWWTGLSMPPSEGHTYALTVPEETALVRLLQLRTY